MGGTLENAAVDLGSVQFTAASPDPMRPTDIVVPPGVAQVPPCCPICFSLVHPVNQNIAGDVLFECLNYHTPFYQAVYRKAAQAWEQRPGQELQRWAPPLTHAEARRRLAARQGT